MKRTAVFLSIAITAFAGHPADRVATVTDTPGLVAFWDFVKCEPDGAHRFTAHVPAGAKTDYPLDAANYVKDYWGAGREATYADFPLLGRGPFGNAIRIVKETDADFRPFLFVPRARLHDTPLDIKGAGKSVTVVVWAIRESGGLQLGSGRLPHPCAWVLGHEGQGVDPVLAAACAHTVRIPQPGGEESLNVAAAAAVCLYASTSAQ